MKIAVKIINNNKVKRFFMSTLLSDEWKNLKNEYSIQH